MDYKAPKFSPATFLNKAFPPPEFLKMPALGVDVSDTVIRYIDLGNKNGQKYVKSFGEESVPSGAVTAGSINKPAEIEKVLSTIKSKTGASFVKVSLPEEKAYLFEMQVPKLPDDELYEAVGFRLEENAPISAKEAIYDFTILDYGNSKSDHLDVIVSVIPSKVSETYAQVFNNAGLTPLSFEIGSQAICRAVVNADSPDSFLVMNLGETKTGFSIVSHGIVFFTSTLPIGSSALDEVEAKEYGVSVRDLAGIKAEIIKNGKQDMKIFLEIMKTTDSFKEEIKKLSAYWRAQSVKVLHKPSSLNKIILCGRDTAIPSVDEYIETSTGIKTEVANVWQNVFSFENYIPPISRVDSLDYAGAIGLALSV